MSDRREEVLDNVGTDYERADMRLAIFAVLAIIIVALLGFSPLILRGAFPRAADDVDRKLAVIPPSPELQTSPQEDLKAFRARQIARLHSYGWVDRDKGIVHIPIDRAMQELVQKGIPGFPKAAP